MSPKRSFLRILADGLLTRWLHTSYVEEFLGDLDEMYQERRDAKGWLVAEIMYVVDALHLIAGFSSTRAKTKSHSTMFIGNMLKITWRNAVRQKQFTVLNLSGLTLGIATCVAIGLYIYDETTYDTFHPNGDRIYRVNQPFIWGDWNEQFPATGPGVAEALKSEIPELEEVTRILNVGDRMVRVSHKDQTSVFTETRFFYTDYNFLTVFKFPFIKGSRARSLVEPNSVVLTASTAKRYFGDDDAVGRTIEIKWNDGTYTQCSVTGVVADLPHRSHLQFDVLCSLSSVRQMEDHSWKWIWTAFSTYVVVREGTDMASLTEKIQLLPPRWAARTTKEVFNQPFDEFVAGKKWTLYLQPVRDIYLARSPDSNRFGPMGNPQFVLIFGVIGALVLALSCINFMNLSTARSGNRAKEVGVRKTLGSQKSALVRQFIFESIAYVTVATVAALIIVQLSLNAFNVMAERQLVLIDHFTNPYFAGSLIAFILILGAAAGSYPAFYLSAFKPAETLKGRAMSGLKNKGIRNTLVVFQFTVSIALIICTIFVQKQLSYVGRLDLGIAKDNILQISNMAQLGGKLDAFREKLKANPVFTDVAKSHSLPPYVWDGDRYRADGPDKPVQDLASMRIDESYLPLLKVEFLAGRNFDAGNVTDRHKVIINEECARVLGFGTRDRWVDDSPVGKFIVQAFGTEEKLEVIGVVKDFNFNSVKQRILPLLIMHEDNDKHWSYGSGPAFLSLRLNPASVSNRDDLQDAIDDVKAALAEVDPSVLFEFSFLDQEFENTFRSERRLSVILNLFTGLAITIACLGLFGLAAFSADRRKKELGIRKVHGASVSQLLLVFSAEFTKLVLIGIVLAVPIAYFATDYWLSSFANRTPIEVWVFVTAGVSALMIALLAVGHQSLAAANNNPAEVLKSE